jgi:hypothetical protein
LLKRPLSLVIVILLDLPVDFSEVVDSSRIQRQRVQKLSVGITQDECDGMADALGTLIFGGPGQARFRDKVTTVFGGVRSFYKFAERRDLQTPSSTDRGLYGAN